MSAHLAKSAVYIVAAKRTACGAFGGKLKDLTATDLAVHSTQAALADAKLDPKNVDSIVFGNVAHTASDAIYLPRHVGIRSDMRTEAPALGVNRLCGSGFQAVVTAAQEILLGESNVVIAGGAENMSQSPYALRNVRWGTKFGVDQKLEDTLWGGLTDSLIKTPMGITAENLAQQYNISRQESDAFSVRSQHLWGLAHAAGRFNAEICNIRIKGRKGEEDMHTDEHPRPTTTIEQLAKLAPVFKKDGIVHAGSSSGICDGAATLIVVSESAMKKFNLTPLARIVGWGVAGVDPKIMGIGPAPAITHLLKLAHKNINNIDLVEVNEAFAPQCLAVAKEIGVDMNKLNTNGGAIALGHPLGMSGPRILTHLTHEGRRSGAKLSIGSACIGGGQGIAVLLEHL